MIRALVVLGLVCGLAGGAHAAQASDTTETATRWYRGADYAGWSTGSGGLLLEQRLPAHSVTVPPWATSALVQIRDDRGRAVHGVATTLAHGFTHEQAVFCSGAATRISVRYADELRLRISAGVTTDRLGQCDGPLSLPTTGTITVVFTRSAG